MSIRMQMDDNGNHRLVTNEKKGSWALYQTISSLEWQGNSYIGVSSYYDGILPIEIPLCVTKDCRLFTERLLLEFVFVRMEIVEGTTPE